MGNIGYTQPGSTQPEVKGHPHWCPRALMVEPYKITKARAYDIINQCLPLGLFYVNENDTLFTGIDNRTGEVWVEEFSSQEECFQWLLDPNKEV